MFRTWACIAAGITAIVVTGSSYPSARTEAAEILTAQQGQNTGIVPPATRAPNRAAPSSSPGATSSGPSQMPREVEVQIRATAGLATVSAEPEQSPDLSALTGNSYIYDTLRVITKNASRGCNSGDWNCMANLCKQDLGQTAWRGWGGCDPHNNDYICYFECSVVKSTF